MATALGLGLGVGLGGGARQSPPPRVYTTWILGDDVTTQTVSAGGSLVSIPIDVSRLIFAESSFLAVISGSGTGQISIRGSQDGFSDWQSLGNVATGLTAGTYVYSLSASPWGSYPYYEITVTETGGSSTISVKALVMGRGR